MRQFSTITWKNEFVTSVPSGATAARKGNDWTTFGSASGTSASIMLNGYSSYLFTVYTVSNMEAAFILLANYNGTFTLVNLHTEGSLNISLSGTTITMSSGSSTTYNYKYITIT
jgi:hypothetical protein